MLVLATVLMAGVLGGALARWAGLPRIVGQIVLGLLLGPSALALFDHHAVGALEPITLFALGLMAVTVGAHLNLRRLRNAHRRLLLLALAEAVVTPLLVFVLLVPRDDVPPWLAALLATLAVSTAPATVVAVVKEVRAKGPFTKTLIGAVALNNVVCIALFEGARLYARIELDAVSGGALLSHAQDLAWPILGAFAVGAPVAVALNLMRPILQRSGGRMASAALAAILLTVGAAEAVSVSPLLACLVLGAVQTNLDPKRERLADSAFTNFEPAILAVFFTLAGIELDLKYAFAAGLVALLLLVGRAAGKVLAARWAMRVAGAPRAMRDFLGVSLIPQAGLAIGLMLLIQDDPALGQREGVLEVFVPVVVSVVTLNEILGPLLLRWSLRRSGEVDRDRVRLMDFLQEENITTDFHATSIEDAIEQLADQLVSSHHLQDFDRDAFLASVLERERLMSTCFGEGLAVPHGMLPEDLPMLGVMALSRDGLDFQTPDGRPVHCMVLLGTPPNDRDRHLQVLAALARVVGTDPERQDRLFGASSPAHAAELLHGEGSEEFNDFLDGEDRPEEEPATNDSRGREPDGAA